MCVHRMERARRVLSSTSNIIIFRTALYILVVSNYAYYIIYTDNINTYINIIVLCIDERLMQLCNLCNNSL
jgi:hypothetical protein